MKLHNDIGNREIIKVIKDHPRIGEILDNYEIGCIKCSIGTCFLKDVVAVHVLGDDIEALIEKEINEYLEKL
jgi:hypothetical protein